MKNGYCFISAIVLIITTLCLVYPLDPVIEGTFKMTMKQSLLFPFIAFIIRYKFSFMEGKRWNKFFFFFFIIGFSIGLAFVIKYLLIYRLSYLGLTLIISSLFFLIMAIWNNKLSPDAPGAAHKRKTNKVH